MVRVPSSWGKERTVQGLDRGSPPSLVKREKGGNVGKAGEKE
jgi:hypothetical protein